MRSVQRGISTFFLIISILTIAVACGAGYFAFSQNLKEKVTSINSFEDCAKHYPVMESYPEQCQVPGGKHFTRELSEEEQQKLSSSQPKVVGQNIPGSPSVLDSWNSGDNETANWKTYTNSTEGYLIKYPEEWVIMKDNPFDGNIVGGFKIPTSDDQYLSLNIDTTTKDISYERYAYFHYLGGKTTPKKVNEMTIDDVVWEKWAHVESGNETSKNAPYVLATTHNGKKFFLIKNYSLPSQDLEKNSDLIDQAILTFKFL
jgi:hypothetical protein